MAKHQNLIRLFVFLLFASLFLNIARAQEVRLDTITNFSKVSVKQAVYKSPKGAFYKVAFEDAPGEAELDVSRPSSGCADSIFTGVARKAAKESIAKASIEVISTVSALIKSFPSDAAMRKKVNMNSLRVTAENRNVRLAKDTYLYAFKKENDNDFHVIIGDNIDPKKATFINTEVAGLPNTTDKKFIAVRQAFEKQFVNVCSGQYAVFFANPIKIQIEGSVFFDVDHKAGQIGPVGLQPQTTWEIHPLTKIVFR